MAGNGDPSNFQTWDVVLDSTKRYFVLRRPEDKDTKTGDAILTIRKNEAEKHLKGICDKVHCGVSYLDHIYCYGCEAISHGICIDHPLVFVIERPVKMEADALRTLPRFLCLKQSNIPNSGVGVFTSIFLAAGSTFGPYGGTMVYGDDSEINSDYSWEIETPIEKEKLTVDASDPKRSNYLRWINCARYKEEQNMVVLQYHKRMYYVVFKPIYPGTELLVWYGDSYGTKLNIENLRRSTDVYAPPKEKRDPHAIMKQWTSDQQ